MLDELMYDLLKVGVYIGVPVLLIIGISVRHRITTWMKS